MEQLFDTLNGMMSGGIAFTLIASFVWGILSVALSPCHLLSIPLIIGYVDSTEERKFSRRFVIASLFALGILVSIGIIGVATAALGRVAGDLGNWTNWFASAIFAFIGFSFLGIIPLNFSGLSSIPIKKKGRLAALLIGLIFGLALGPCSFAFMVPVLAVTFVNEANSVFSSSLILLAYGLGHSLLIVLAGSFTGTLQRYLNWNNEKQHTVTLKKIVGILLLVGSLYFLAK